MIYERSTLAVAIFAVFVGITLGLSFYLGRRAKSASGYFAAVSIFYLIPQMVGAGALIKPLLGFSHATGV